MKKRLRQTHRRYLKTYLKLRRPAVRFFPSKSSNVAIEFVSDFILIL